MWQPPCPEPSLSESCRWSITQSLREADLSLTRVSFRAHSLLIGSRWIWTTCLIRKMEMQQMKDRGRRGSARQDASPITGLVRIWNYQRNSRILAGKSSKGGQSLIWISTTTISRVSGLSSAPTQFPEKSLRRNYPCRTSQQSTWPRTRSKKYRAGIAKTIG